MYSVFGYGEMMADRVRMKAYEDALRRCVTPGSAVLDIGTGAGIFAMLACRCGARRVYAIEPDDVILLAHEIASANGFAERIDFIHGTSSEIDLPEHVDVIVSDLRGILPLFDHHLPSILDARRRFLAPGGTLIPRHDVLRAAVVEAPGIYSSYVTAWNGNGFDLRMQAGRRLVTNTWRKASFDPEQLLTKPQTCAILDYRTLENQDVDAQLTWAISRSGTGHGLSIWFDSMLTEGVSFSNAPGAPELIYGNAFFPWSTAVDLSEGDMVSVTLQAKLIGTDYVWTWDTRIESVNEPTVVKARFKQSTFYGSPMSPTTLRKRGASHVPRVTEDGEIDRHILMLMDGNTPLNDIAAEVVNCFRHRFPDGQSALTRVGELSQRYSL